MVVAEILTGIALVKKSVDFIKENISTVQDIQGIAKQIDGFFLGEEQMNKKQGKGIGIKEQFGIESTANDFIDRKLLEEKRNELKMIINMRFGPTAWDQILAERAERINQAKEAQRQAKIKARQQQKEIMDILKWGCIIFFALGVGTLLLVLGVKAFADGKMYNAPKDYTYKQKVWQGKIVEKKYTTCRLKKRVTSKYTNKKGCIYEGGNKTFTMMIETWCPVKYKCVYDPNGQEPDIDKVMESLRSIKE
jgi:glucan-binding YG repeat protein